MPKSTTPLLSALSRLRMVVTADAAQAERDIKILLGNGEDPNGSDANGRTPLSFFHTDKRAADASDQIRSKNWLYIDAIKCLIEHGADPLVNGGSLLEALGESYQTQVVMTLLERSQEKGQDGLDIFLQSLDHVYFNLFQNAAWTFSLDYRDHIDYQRKTDGNNLLHIFWGTHIASIVSKVKNPTYVMGVVGEAWDYSNRVLAPSKAMLGAENHEGKSVAGIILDLVEQGMHMNPETSEDPDFQRMLVEERARRLARSTPKAKGRRASTRL